LQQRSIEERVKTLEHALATLMTLPGEVSVLRSEFHAFRIEMRDFTDEMRQFQDVVASNFTRLEREVRQGDDETRRLMLALHQKVMDRFDALERGHK
jgi:predicted RNase H-like nuclease (RuvC/YqgF family)